MERKEFYKQLKCFLKELIVVFPEDDDDLLTITTSINLAIIDDEDTQIIRKFYNAMSQVHYYILDRNDIIFNTISFDPSSYEHHLFEKLRNRWSTFTKNNQTVIWDYIQVLYTLSIKLFT